VGTVQGKIEVFKLECQFEYENGFLGGLGEVSEFIGGDKQDENNSIDAT
jgi:hypothetical protein